MAAVAPLHGLAKIWLLDADLKQSVQKSGLHGLVQKAVKDQMIAKYDEWHAVSNPKLIMPVIHMMRYAHLLRTPHLENLAHEVAVFALLFQDKAINAENLETTHKQFEVEVHCVSSSIKKILGFLRQRYLKGRVPRDRFVAQHRLGSCYSFSQDRFTGKAFV